MASMQPAAPADGSQMQPRQVSTALRAPQVVHEAHLMANLSMHVTFINRIAPL